MTRRRRAPAANNQATASPLEAANPMDSVLQAISAISSLRAKVQGMKDNIANIERTLQGQHQELSGNRDEIEVLSNQNVNIREKIGALQLSLAVEKKQEEAAERNCTLEIYGIDEKNEEDISAIVAKIFDLLKLNIIPTSVKESRRIIKPKGNTFIQVKFISQEFRDKVVTARRGIPLKNLHSKQINKKLQKRTVYINPCLTAESKAILFAAKKLQTNGWKYLWAKDGKVFARRTEDTKAVHLTDRAMINNLLFEKPRLGLVFPFSEELRNLK